MGSRAVLLLCQVDEPALETGPTVLSLFAPDTKWLAWTSLGGQVSPDPKVGKAIREPRTSFLKPGADLSTTPDLTG